MQNHNESPIVSVVIPVFNQIEYTKKCLESLLRDRDRPSYEIIVIDNGSIDGTREYLESMTDSLRGTRDVFKPIFNAENEGVAPAWNKGLKNANGEYIAILNNDIVVSNGWMRSLLWAMEQFKLGLISPFAEVGGQIGYDFEARAERFTRRNFSKLWADYDFCAFVLTRRTFDKIGYFDEGYRVGGYEDTDYAHRLKRAGVSYAVSGAAFIHHFGSRTLGEFKMRGDQHAPHNLSYFVEKWGFDPRHQQATAKAKIRRSIRRLKLHWDLM